MITFPEIPGVEVPIFLLLFMGFTVGIVGGFMGVGGGFLITPALVVLGFPANMAVGTDTTQIAGNSIVVTLRHSRLGNVDLKLGLIMAIGTVVGAEGGVRVIEWLQSHGIDEQVVLVASLILMTSIGALTFRETMASRRRMKELKAAGKPIPRDDVSSGLAKKLQSINMRPMIWLPTSRVVVSFWTVTAIGMATGFLSGFLGVGGGFIRVPAMIYLLGMPSLVAVGTDLFSIIVSAGYATVRHGMEGNVVPLAAFIMIFGAAMGSQIGALGTAYVRGPAVRLLLVVAVAFGAAAATVKLADVMTDESIALLDIAAKVIMFGGMATLVSLIMGLVGVGVVSQRRGVAPAWAEALVVTR
jgi:uncharacterized membrane protein YfcA